VRLHTSLPEYQGFYPIGGGRVQGGGGHRVRHSYRTFDGYRTPYRNRYMVVPTHRVVRAHRLYAPNRVTSVSVRTRSSGAVGHYRTTRVVHIRPGGVKRCGQKKT